MRFENLLSQHDQACWDPLSGGGYPQSIECVYILRDFPELEEIILYVYGHLWKEVVNHFYNMFESRSLL